MLPTTSIVASLTPIVIPLLVAKLKVLEVLRVPPLIVSWLATTLPGAVPSPSSAEMLIVPLLIVVIPE